MNPTQITNKIWFGYGKAAQKLGQPHQQFRPTNGTFPSSSLKTLPAIFSQDMQFAKFNKYGNAVWFVLVDGRATRVGDYLVGAKTWFIIEQMPDLPLAAVLCNHVVSVKRPAQAGTTGLGAYVGNTLAGESALMTGFPVSMLDGSKGESGVGLPGDVRDPWWKVLLPAAPGVTIDTRDILYDENNNRFVVSMAELSEFGWRISALQAVP